MGTSPSRTDHRKVVKVTNKNFVYEGQVKVFSSMCGPPLTILDGEGKYTTPDGYMYEGNFVDGMAHGKGKGIWPDGVSIEGEWANATPFGHCRLEQKESRWKTVIGTFEGKSLKSGGCLIGDDEIYRGNTKNNLPHGYGRLQKPNGEILYAGEWANGNFHGHGKVYENGKLVYSGNFHYGLRHGNGRIWEGKSLIEKGKWDHGRKVEIKEDVDDMSHEPSAPPYDAMKDDGKRNPLECPICMENTRNYLFKPCNHLATCKDCSSLIDTCPFCKVVKTSSILIYIP